MKVLVTGATGFLGRHLCTELDRRGDDVLALGSQACDLRRQGELDRVATDRYERIYHLAAWTQAGDFCLRHPGEQWVINQQINTNVLDWWHREQPEAKLISIGTSCSYAPDLPLQETEYLNGRPIDGLFTYAMTKRMLYAGVLALHMQFDHRYLCVVPSTLYGPGYHTHGKQMHFIFDLIRKIWRGKLYDETVELWGDGHQSRELIHVDDFVTTMLGLADNVENDLVNIGAGEEHTIRRFAQLICERVDYDFDKIVFDTSKYVGAKSKCLDTSKLKDLLPDLRLKPLDEGLASTIDWVYGEREALLPPPGEAAP